MKITKKILSIILVITLLFTTTITVAANPLLMERDTGIARIITDNREIRVAVTEIDGYKYVSTYNKITHDVNLERFSLITGELEATAVTNINDLSNITIIEDDEAINHTTSTVLSRFTDTLYAYIITHGTTNVWELRRPRYQGEPSLGSFYFKTNQTSSNQNNLTSFRNSVDNIRQLELDFYTLVGVTSGLAAFATGFLIGSGGLGWGAAVAVYIASIGFGVAAQQKATQLGTQKNNAFHSYFQVFHNSVVFF